MAFRVANKLLVIQHVQHEGPDLIAELARERGMAVQTLWPASGDGLPRPEACTNSIAVVLGGPMGVDDRHKPGMEWLQRELDWLTSWHQQRRPVLGICLGAQLLAVAAGGSVQPLQVGQPPQRLKELGFGAIHWIADARQEPQLRGLHPSTLALHWHGDRIKLPDQATLLGSSLHCAEQVFRIGRHGFGLQCHVEISGPSLERWIAQDRDYVISALGADGPEQLRKSWQQLNVELNHGGRLLLNRVLDRCCDALDAANATANLH